jgi:hypothetical protein
MGELIKFPKSLRLQKRKKTELLDGSKLQELERKLTVLAEAHLELLDKHDKLSRNFEYLVSRLLEEEG